MTAYEIKKARKSKPPTGGHGKDDNLPSDDDKSHNPKEVTQMKYTLVGVDGNAFAIMGYTARALRNEGLGDKVSEMQTKAMSGDYNNLLCVCMEYIDMANDKAAIENGWEDEEDEEYEC